MQEPEQQKKWVTGVEYCNLENEGKYAKWRIANGEEQPYNVKYWSIGNENYGNWEIGAKSSEEWWRLVKESAKMIKHVSPTVELSAAALPDIDWTMNLLKHCGEYLDWILCMDIGICLRKKWTCRLYSVHGIHGTGRPGSYWRKRSAYGITSGRKNKKLLLMSGICVVGIIQCTYNWTGNRSQDLYCAER